MKGKINVELAVDILTLAPYCDTIILASRSGEFTRLVEAVQQHGCCVVVLSSARPGSSTIADELRRQADEFLEIAEIAGEVAMRGREGQAAAGTKERPHEP